MVHRPLALTFADISKGFHTDSAGECGCDCRFLRVQCPEEVESEPCAGRAFLFVRSLDDALRACNRIVHVPASRSPSHSCASRIIASKSDVLDSLLGLAFGCPSVSGGRKGQFHASFQAVLDSGYLTDFCADFSGVQPRMAAQRRL